MKKRSFFSWRCPFQRKLLFLPNNRISKARICHQCWFKKISRKQKTKQQKKLQGNAFPLGPKSHAKIELIWTRKKIRPKKSLTSLLHEAFQLLLIIFITMAEIRLRPPTFHTLCSQFPHLQCRSPSVSSTLVINIVQCCYFFSVSPHWVFSCLP